MNEIIELNHRIEGNGIFITDIINLFKDNNPVSQLETGLQKNGDYFCWKPPKHSTYYVLTKHISS